MLVGKNLRYKDKFIAFVDILGFKEIVKKSEISSDADSVARMLRRLGSDEDAALYQNLGPVICPDSEKLSSDLNMRISQVSDCVVISSEISPAGAINIIDFCRQIAERLLLREGVLCKGYLTRGEIVHEGMLFFGPGYQDAIEGEKNAAAIVTPEGKTGTPFIEIDNFVVKYFEKNGDDCTRKMFSRMTILSEKYALISPYLIFDRIAEWSVDPSKSESQMRNELTSAKEIINRVEFELKASKPVVSQAKVKLDISLRELSKARNRLSRVEEMLVGVFHNRTPGIDADHYPLKTPLSR